jgi:hypothetical protein
MTIEFGNVIFKIAVTRDDGVKDYTDVCDLIFYDEETEEILRYIDAEDWSKFDKWANLIGPLRHVTNGQLIEFVDSPIRSLRN